jgi:thiosulfate sulfurtransferase
MKKTDFEQIDAQKAKDLIDQGGTTIVDIRDTRAFKEAHIPSAISVDDSNVQNFISQTDKDKPLICYCYHGHSSQSAAQYFFQQGFKNVFSIIGGFEKWRTSYPITKD